MLLCFLVNLDHRFLSCQQNFSIAGKLPFGRQSSPSYELFGEVVPNAQIKLNSVTVNRSKMIAVVSNI